MQIITAEARQNHVTVLSEDPLRRAAIESLLAQSGWSYSSFSDAHEFLDHAGTVGTSCAAIDLKLTTISASDLIGRCHTLFPQMSIIGIGSELSAVLLGAENDSLVIDEGVGLGDIRSALTEAMCGRSRAVVAYSPTAARLLALTPRQREVLAWVSAGADNLKIAAELGICERTVKAHISRMLEVFALDNRTELAVLGCRAGFRPPATTLSSQVNTLRDSAPLQMAGAVHSHSK